jgi:ubiquinone/menaquinone biosynthesis C-methylase UbiE
MLKALHAPIYAKRIQVLTELIVCTLQEGDRVLDVGCGVGALGKAIQDHPDCPAGVVVSGCEKYPRGNEAIPVIGFDGYKIPAEDQAFEVTILADVVHHEPNPDALLSEVARVTGRSLIIKDHIEQGLLARQRICLIDWAANAAWGVKCLFRYFSTEEWQDHFQKRGFQIETDLKSIDLYPPVFNLLFGRRLQYYAVAVRKELWRAGL